MAVSRTNLYFSPEIVSVRTYDSTVESNGNLIKLVSKNIVHNKYKDGTCCIFVSKGTNTGNVTVQLDNLPPKPLVTKEGQQIMPNEIQNGDIYQLLYIGDRNSPLYDKFILAAIGGGSGDGVSVYSTDAEMKASLKLRAGFTVITLGSVSEDDGKGNIYYIKDANSGNDIALENGKFAHKITTEALKRALDLEVALGTTNNKVDQFKNEYNTFKSNQLNYNNTNDGEITSIKSSINTINDVLDGVHGDNTLVNQKIQNLQDSKTDVGYTYGGELSTKTNIQDRFYYKATDNLYYLNVGGNRVWQNGNGVPDNKMESISLKTIMDMTRRGTTALRPDTATTGTTYFDTDLNKLLVFSSNGWETIDVEGTSGKLKITKNNHGFKTGNVLAYEDGEWVLADISNRVDTNLLKQGKAICIKISDNEFYSVINGIAEYKEDIMDTNNRALENGQYYLVSNIHPGKLTKDTDGVVIQTAVYVFHVNNKKYIEVLLSGGMDIPDNSIDGNGVMSYSIIVDQIGHGFQSGDALFYNGVAWELANISDPKNMKQVKGICLKIDDNKFRALLGGVHKLNVEFNDKDGRPLQPGEFYFLSVNTPGKITMKQESAVTSQVVLHCLKNGTTKYIDLLFNQGVESQDMTLDNKYYTKEESDAKYLDKSGSSIGIGDKRLSFQGTAVRRVQQLNAITRSSETVPYTHLIQGDINISEDGLDIKTNHTIEMIVNEDNVGDGYVRMSTGSGRKNLLEVGERAFNYGEQRYAVIHAGNIGQYAPTPITATVVELQELFKR